MLTMLAAVAELERSNIKFRQMAGIAKAKSKGKALGREKTIDDAAVAIWRKENSASIKLTAEHFGISPASIKDSSHNEMSLSPWKDPRWPPLRSFVILGLLWLNIMGNHENLSIYNQMR